MRLQRIQGGSWSPVKPQKRLQRNFFLSHHRAYQLGRRLPSIGFVVLQANPPAVFCAFAQAIHF
jgi:hypothetical protein